MKAGHTGEGRDTGEGRHMGEHRAHRYVQVRAGTQVSTGCTSEQRAHR